MLLNRPRTAPEPGRDGRSRRRRGLALALAVTAAILSVPATSYVNAITSPGSADWQTTSVEWLRDHHAGRLVDVAENWWYAHNQPTGAAPAAGTLPSRGQAATVPAPAPAAAPAAAPPPLPALPGAPRLDHEGEWIANPDGGAVPALYSSYFRPDPAYPSQVVGVAWMNQDLTAVHLLRGTAEPVPGTAPADAQVPQDLRDQLVAVFNSGWKMRDSRGGFFADGRSVVPLRDGRASLVIDRTGRVVVGQWGRDVRMGPDTAAVRQNLDIVVDGGKPVDGLASNAGGAWGTPRNQFQFTWRSGLGTDAAGNLVYVAGDQLDLAGLANALIEAGVQRGMELDIHPKTVAFNVVGLSGSDRYATKLLPAMVSPTRRYLVPDHRDFLAVTRRAAH